MLLQDTRFTPRDLEPPSRTGLRVCAHTNAHTHKHAAAPSSAVHSKACARIARGD